MTVLRNVVDNGLKYSSSENGRVDIGAIRDIDHISIYIEDNGPGIPEEKIPFITEPFYRADESRSRTLGGYGLGLHLCKRIMDLHHAAFLLENKKEGKGLMVTLTFPLKQ
jgi:signal transduction histidine kinase